MAAVRELYIVSYNMHGFNQGLSVVEDLTDSSHSPDVILLQEHWLTPAKLVLFEEKISTHYAFGKSAMADLVTKGPLFGRPFGGTSILVKTELRADTECIVCADRYVIVRIGNLLIVNVYLPCVGTVDRMNILNDVLQEIWSWRIVYPNCSLIIGGDFNTELEKQSDASIFINTFIAVHALNRCDVKFSVKQRNTYVNDALGHSSLIDYFISDLNDNDIIDYCVLDPDLNLSDHLPIAIQCKCLYLSSPGVESSQSRVKQLRWDKADLLSYYNATRCLLYPLYDEIVSMEVLANKLTHVECENYIDYCYNVVVEILKKCSEQFVPVRHKKYYKFWWSQELSCLKEEAVESNAVWKAAGRPRSGPIANKRNADKRRYKKMLNDQRRAETQTYSNDLHEALIRKSGANFWKCWKSKFETVNKSNKIINGLSDESEIAEAFAEYFCKICTTSNEQQNSHLRSVYRNKRQSYIGGCFLDSYKFDIELIETVSSQMKRGKAAGLDELTTEHIVNSHPVLMSILTRLFNLIMSTGYVPHGFRLSFTVPIPKSECGVKGNNIENYRAISISPVISKIFEHCILARYSEFLTTSENQFGFKKGYGCSHAIYSVRKVVDHYVSAGSTVNVCLLDLSKAFDKMNHYALFIKLMDRLIPVEMLCVLENWFSLCLSCVKWGSVMSRFYQLKTGVRQGGVLSPFLFGIFIDDLVKLVDKTNIGCRIAFCCTSIFLYADDVILLAPSVHALQLLFNICEKHLNDLDMTINPQKSACLRFGPRHKHACASVTSVSGKAINWVPSARYLGVYFESSFKCKCVFDANKAGFYKSFNSIFGKIGRSASEEVLFSLIRSKCLPVLYYGIDVCPINSAITHSLQFTINRVFFKVFGAMSNNSYCELSDYFGIPSVMSTVRHRQDKFVNSYSSADNVLCRTISVKTIMP
jgi:exonuclease III